MAAKFNEAKAEAICEGLCEGKSLVAIVKQDGMPSYRQVMRWLDENEEFRHSYARAREIQADNIFDECLTIADSKECDVIVDDDGNEIVNHDAIARAKLRIDTRKWMAGKLRPKKYGDSIDVTSAGKQIAGIAVSFVDPET